MSTVWLVQKKGSQPDHLCELLVGNFPTRCFSSFNSMSLLLPQLKQEKPFLLILVEEVSTKEIVQLTSRFPEMVILALRQNDTDEEISRMLLRSEQRIYRAQIDYQNCELMAWIRKVKDSSVADRGHVLAFEDLVLDYVQMTLKLLPDSQILSLSPLETRLLKLLLSHIGDYISKDHIRFKVWDQVKVSPRTIDSHMSRLRKRISGSALTIQNKYGLGYRLAHPE